jgi:8-oxo-dGTP diphosphatase
MQAAEQGVEETGKRRYMAIPRTLIFLTSSNPTNGEQEILLLKGAPTKRLWANRYNGLGGHIEANEDILHAARREVHEETGLAIDYLELRGIINIDTGAGTQQAPPGVLVFVFTGASPARTVHATAEGMAEWLPVAELQHYPLVDDLHLVIPRTLARGPLFFGHYSPEPDGTLRYHFT